MMEQEDIDKIALVFKAYKELKRALREAGISNSEGNILSEIGEWLATQIFGGLRASKSNQRHCDINYDGVRRQVKTHAKAEKNRTRWTLLNYPEDAQIDELIIIIFTSDLVLKEIYKIPWADVQPKISKRKKPNIAWNTISAYSLEINKLPHQEIIKLFQ
jgi:hypothetical protein